jgi:hypothetical protein
MNRSIEVVQLLHIESTNEGIELLANDVLKDISSHSGYFLDFIVSFLKYLENELKGLLVNSINLDLMIGEKIRHLAR